jgi:hypothetical protein
MAYFNLTAAAENETEMRPDETIMLEFRVDGESARIGATRAAHCMCCFSLFFGPCCPCVYFFGVRPMYEYGESLSKKN